ncbi:hypothetical protein [Chryseobacterium sp. JM1]|uniref:hypothetical protein n=1 Tax=Chryseobacterium sp. JM1 TaxID=1233950 RepID=UPI0004E6FA7B|nr:hypothetical protein [Chryseobacterium sp. JM1]KFF16993.1 hypothetical protein IW22_21645 [Chryseobacterium sp. JM1]
MSIYKIEDINVGDEVYFRSKEFQSNFDLDWEVTSISGKWLTVKLEREGDFQATIITIDEVVRHTPKISEID